MFFSFRSKLFLLSLVLISGFLLISGAYLHMTLEDWTETQIAGDLEIRTHLISTALTAITDGEDQEYFLRSLRDRHNQYISLVTRDGAILADTYLDEDASDTTDLASSPEIAAAWDLGFGRARRFSDNIGQESLYAAALIGEDGPVVRVAMPLDDVNQAITHLRLLLFIGGFFGLGVAIFMSSFASSLMSKNLQKVLARSRQAHSRPTNSLQQITAELERTLATLATERDRFRAVLDGMSEGVLTIDENLKVIMTNDATGSLLRLRRDLADQQLTNILPPDPLLALIDEARTHGSAGGEFDLNTANITVPRRILARVTTRQRAGGFILVLHDVTALRRLETMRRDFVANVSHELRTPVAIIQANAETLLDGALDSPTHARTFTEGIHRNSERLGRLVSDLLDISRIEAGQRNFDLRSLSIHAAVLRALEVTGQGQEQLLDRIELQIDEALKVRADIGALDQVLVNLIDNAIKYGSPDGPIDILASPKDNAIEVAIRDHGPGLASEHHHRVFERFYRVDEGRSTQMGGTGLGLSIVKHLVTSMNGEVGYRPHPQGGSVFWFHLPRAPNPE